MHIASAGDDAGVGVCVVAVKGDRAASVDGDGVVVREHTRVRAVTDEQDAAGVHDVAARVARRLRIGQIQDAVIHRGRAAIAVRRVAQDHRAEAAFDQIARTRNDLSLSERLVQV